MMPEGPPASLSTRRDFFLGILVLLVWVIGVAYAPPTVANACAAMTMVTPSGRVLGPHAVDAGPGSPSAPRSISSTCSAVWPPLSGCPFARGTGDTSLSPADERPLGDERRG